MPIKRKKIVVVGGGFGGIKAALETAKLKECQVTLISDRDHFLMYPSLYSTATGWSRQQSMIQLDEVFHGSTVKIVHDTVTDIDPRQKVIIGKDDKYNYDKAIFALGVVTNYFGIKGLDTYSYSIKSAPEIDRFKNHLHQALAHEKHIDKNYVVIGGGPTGVELSAALATYVAQIADKHGIDHKKLQIDLIEAAPRVLPRMSEKASQLVYDKLLSLNVSVMTNKNVESENKNSVLVSGVDMPSHTVVWTSGVSNHPFFQDNSDVFTLAENKRVMVDEHLMAYEDVFVIGDNANTDYSGLAQTAIADGKFVAKVIHSTLHNKRIPAYRPSRPIVVIPVGHNWAIAEYKNLRVKGYPAHILRMLADFICYLDYFSFVHALTLFMTKSHREEDCTTCHDK